MHDATASERPYLAWRAVRSVFWRRLELRFDCAECHMEVYLT